MIKSLLKLIIFVLDDVTFKYDIISLNEQTVVVPDVEIESYLDINESLKYLISKYIDHPDLIQYINPKLGDIHITDELSIYYYNFITFNAKIKNSYKISPDKYAENLPNIQKIIRSIL